MKKTLMLCAAILALVMTSCKSDIQNRETWSAKSFETILLPSNPLYSSTDVAANTLSFDISYPHSLMLFSWDDNKYKKNIVHISKDETDSYYVNENGKLYECANVSPYVIDKDGKKKKNVMRQGSELPHEKEIAYEWNILGGDKAELIFNSSDQRVIYHFEKDKSADE